MKSIIDIPKISSLDDIYNLHTIICNQLKAVLYPYIRVEGNVNWNSFENIEGFKLRMKSNKESDFILIVSGFLSDRDLFYNKIQVVISRNSLLGVKFDVTCESENESKLAEFIELVETKTKKPQVVIKDNIVSKEQLIKDVEAIRDMLISVSTGKVNIQDKNDEYIELQKRTRANLRALNIEYLNYYRDLSEWYSDYKAKKLTAYEERRKFVRVLLSSTLSALDDRISDISIMNNGSSETTTNKFDVFVSHASANKANFVDGLVVDLKKVSDSVWYDVHNIEWGDDILHKISEGLDTTEFAIVVFSQDFFGRKWTELELENLLNKQNEKGIKIVLPILFDCNSSEFVAHYPSLSRIKFIEAKNHTTQDITLMFAKMLIKRLKR